MTKRIKVDLVELCEDPDGLLEVRDEGLPDGTVLPQPDMIRLVILIWVAYPRWEYLMFTTFMTMTMQHYKITVYGGLLIRTIKNRIRLSE